VRVSVVGAALVRDGRVLASRRTGPPQLAGFWEFPGGKVEDGESDHRALTRELAEELGVTAVIGDRLGGDLLIGETAVLRVYVCGNVVGEPQLVDHDAHRWLAADELDDVPWIPVDAPLLDELRQLLGISRTGPSGGADSAGPG
jgi:8-oxo-dGTP diphosphatase